MNPEPPTPSTAGLSRRGALSAAAWTVPVVTLASAAPAFAVSPWPEGLTYLPGATRATTTTDAGWEFYELTFDGALLRVGGEVSPGAILTLQVRFDAVPSSEPYHSDLVILEPSATWAFQSLSGNVATFAYVAPVASGTEIALDGTWVGTDYDGVSGTYTLTVTLSGLTPVIATYATPAAGGASAGRVQGFAAKGRVRRSAAR